MLFMNHRVMSALFIMLMTFAPHTAAQTNDVAPDVAYEVKQTVDAFLYGASINDSDAHRQFWATELTYTSSSGTRFGWPQLAAGLSDEPPLNDDQVSAWYTAEDYQLKQLGDTIVVNFTLVSSPVADGITQRIYNTGVMIYRDHRWQAINWNATVASD